MGWLDVRQNGNFNEQSDFLILSVAPSLASIFWFLIPFSSSIWHSLRSTRLGGSPAISSDDAKSHRNCICNRGEKLKLPLLDMCTVDSRTDRNRQMENGNKRIQRMIYFFSLPVSNIKYGKRNSVWCTQSVHLHGTNTAARIWIIFFEAIESNINQEKAARCSLEIGCSFVFIIFSHLPALLRGRNKMGIIHRLWLCVC